MKRVLGIILMVIGVLIFLTAITGSDITPYIVATALCALGFWLYRLVVESQISEGNQTISYNQVHCPKCGSASIHADKKGFSAGKGCCGFLMCGPLGFLFGQLGANKIRKTCLNCNHSWK